MFKQLHQAAKELPSQEKIDAMPHEKKICIYAPLIKIVCGVIKVIFFASPYVKIGMDGIIAWMNEECDSVVI